MVSLLSQRPEATQISFGIFFSSPAEKNLMFTDEFTASAGVLSSSRISPAAQIFTTSATFLNSLKLMEKIESILT